MRRHDGRRQSAAVRAVAFNSLSQDTQPFDLISLASRRVNVFITVERDTKRSRSLKSKFLEFF